MSLLWRLIKAPGEDKGIISRKKTTGRSVAAGFDWLSTNFLILRRPGLAGRLEGCGPGGAACAAMVRPSRASGRAGVARAPHHEGGKNQSLCAEAIPARISRR